MLTIRLEQMAAFAAPLEARFMERVRAFIETRAPDLAARAGGTLDAQIAERRSDAGALGCETEQELVLFIILSLLNGRDFTEREPWASVVAEHRSARRKRGLPMSLMEASKRAGAAR